MTARALAAARSIVGAAAEFMLLCLSHVAGPFAVPSAVADGAWKVYDRGNRRWMVEK